ncbi:MAG: hypothetical protein WCU88_00065 [Elusimicrobiota bacterium]|jgi:hypothetical protein
MRFLAAALVLVQAALWSAGQALALGGEVRDLTAAHPSAFPASESGAMTAGRMFDGTSARFSLADDSVVDASSEGIDGRKQAALEKVLSKRVSAHPWLPAKYDDVLPLQFIEGPDAGNEGFGRRMFHAAAAIPAGALWTPVHAARIAGRLFLDGDFKSGDKAGAAIVGALAFFAAIPVGAVLGVAAVPVNLYHGIKDLFEGKF